MRSFIPYLKSSCMSLLGKAEITPELMEDRTEMIRELMLEELGDFGAKHYPGVTRRIRYAPDVQGLWYVRSEVMAILASTHGETVASEKIAAISGRFKGLLPASLTSSMAMASRSR
jgi:hypothetical protein